MLLSNFFYFLFPIFLDVYCANLIYLEIVFQNVSSALHLIDDLFLNNYFRSTALAFLLMNYYILGIMHI